MKHKLVYGVGVTDVGYPVAPRDLNGKQQMCPFYKCWKAMLDRCYGAKTDGRNQAYMGCVVTPEWHALSRFKAWMETKTWQGCELDKDLKIPGNRVYSTETCLFVPKVVNNFFIGEDGTQGVSWDSKGNRWVARRGSGTRASRWVRYFKTQEAARREYRKRKWEIGLEILNTKIADLEVRSAFENRLEPYRPVSENGV